MRTIALLLAVVAAIISGQASALTMHDINTTDTGCGIGCLEIGDKQFTNLSSTFDETLIEVYGSQVGNIVSINFGGPFASSNGSSVDINLLYTVQASAGLISMIDQRFNLSAQGNGGNIAIGETVFNVNNELVAQSSVGFIPGTHDANDPPGEIVQGDQLFINPPVSLLHVTKDMLLESAPGGLVGATLITQSFHQVSVPEPGTFLLLGAGLAGVATLARRGIRRHSTTSMPTVRVEKQLLEDPADGGRAHDWT